ncbi:MAG: hypothetical protein V1753_09015 [Pseudomonadota bacterium]
MDTIEEKESVEGVQPIMYRLAEAISSISQELQLVRKAIEEIKGTGLVPANASSQKITQPDISDKIILDFESFVKKRKIDDEDTTHEEESTAEHSPEPNES